MNALIALICGLLFGLGLAVSGMMDPTKVIGFLDVAGHWDPTLAFVMGGALLVNIPAYWLTCRRAQPLFEKKFYLPTLRNIDTRLLAGSACFGIGWGLAGFCPGPALASLGSGLPLIAGFVVAMLIGMLAADQIKRPS